MQHSEALHQTDVQTSRLAAKVHAHWVRCTPLLHYIRSVSDMVMTPFSFDSVKPEGSS